MCPPTSYSSSFIVSPRDCVAFSSCQMSPRLLNDRTILKRLYQGSTPPHRPHSWQSALDIQGSATKLATSVNICFRCWCRSSYSLCSKRWNHTTRRAHSSFRGNLHLTRI
ncbi:hypothetical protein PAXRUDRAFT_661871 [Paxillus rubicundulus Ve08.2h10]|uniref:Uncharacterized protein n=1 Tax=Paxillus rubicundulus Ve08.2h10 TaxID=930991 RepID=A0A0D0DX73_9AGAM|nr:hypothetical protein PAXRUDRAFT_661871 [Paxillus rubicundulus Ve08.2h10]